MLLGLGAGVVEPVALGAQGAEAVLLLLELPDIALAQGRLLRRLAQALQVPADALLVAKDFALLLFQRRHLLRQLVDLVLLRDDAAQRLLDLGIDRALAHPESNLLGGMLMMP